MGKTLSFEMESQEATEWCWAAVAKSVWRFFRGAGSWRQCDIVNAELRLADCCQDPDAPECNRWWYLDRALRRVKHFRRMKHTNSPVAVIRQEVDENRPLGSRIEWRKGGGHFVAIYGYHDFGAATTFIDVGDPWNGDSLVSLAVFTSNYLGMGAWSDSYWVKQ